MSIELILAVIGSITGIASLLIQLFEYLRNKPNMSVHLDEDSPSFYIKTDVQPSEISDLYKNSAKYVGKVNFVIENSKPSAFTIYKIKLRSTNASLDVSDDIFKVQTFVVKKTEGLITTNKMYRSNELFREPCRIDSYDLNSFCLEFAIYETMNVNGNLKVIIDIFTAGKKLSFPVYLNEIHR